LSSSVGQNPTFSCQQLVMNYLSWMIEIWMKIYFVSDYNCNTESTNPQMFYKDQQKMLVEHFVLVTLHCGLQLFLCMIIRIVDTTYHTKCSVGPLSNTFQKSTAVLPKHSSSLSTLTPSHQVYVLPELVHPSTILIPFLFSSINRAHAIEAPGGYRRLTARSTHRYRADKGE